MKSLSLALIILAFGQMTPAKGSGRSIRIVTFNVQCLAAPETRASRIPRYRWDFARREHIERVANVVETLQPDILNLVEVTSSDVVDALVSILHEKGMVDYRGFHVESHDTFTGFDVALITRLQPDVVEDQAIRCIVSPPKDMTWREKYSYEDDQGVTHQRETTVARHAVYYFSLGKHRLGFLGLHLKADPSDNYSNSRRTAESTIVQRIIQKEIVARNYLPIVLGDLNDYDPDVPDRDPTRSTQTKVIANIKNYDPTTPVPELVNPGNRIVRIADRFTSHWDRNENGVADSMDVFTTVDYILLPTDFESYVRRVFVSRCFDLKTSDHWPVVVDVDLP